MTSYAGLELSRRFLRGVGFFAALRRVAQAASVGGDFSLGKTMLTVLLVGAKRVGHLAFLRGDPMFLRLVGLMRAPTERTLGRALEWMSFRTWPLLDELSVLVNARRSREGRCHALND